MILGIGTDLTDIRRIEESIAKFGERFLARIFTGAERAAEAERGNRPAGYAKRFAAKEACAKALGTGIAKGVSWQDMEVTSLPGGKPELRLSGGALQRLTELTPPGMAPQVDLSLSDEYPLAQAFVVVSAEPAA